MLYIVKKVTVENILEKIKGREKIAKDTILKGCKKNNFILYMKKCTYIFICCLILLT
jgi:hypothetical protein